MRPEDIAMCERKKAIVHEVLEQYELTPFFVPEDVRTESHCGRYQLEDLKPATLDAMVQQWVDSVYAAVGRKAPTVRK